ncbi:NAD-binding protein [Methanospirillum sp.]|uniref:potassium channel family protein n=1 Tax=Methanospirillum sp. TaxID=45200 RepID=UPI002D1FACC5|nr:NAD-binding protein [Methanospirillum sp.]
MRRLLRKIQSSYEKQVLFSLVLFSGVILLWTMLFYSLHNSYEAKKISPIEALIFVVETVTTTGYGELLPFSHDLLWGFVLVMMISGVVMFLMLVNLFLTPIIQNKVHPVPPTTLSYPCADHVVIFGYNPVIVEVLEHMHCLGVDIVLIEEDEKKALREAVTLPGLVQVIYGRFDEEKTWNNAGISDCRYILFCLEDMISAEVLLGLRKLTHARVIVITTGHDSDQYLTLCGADVLVHSKDIVGTLTARHALLGVEPDTLATNPVMEKILQETSSAIGTCRFVRIPVIPGSMAEGKTISSLRFETDYHFRLIYLIRKGEVILSPPGDMIIDRSMVLYLIGPGNGLFKLVSGAFLARSDAENLAIIGGLGTMGAVIARDFIQLGLSCVTIDRNPKAGADVTGEIRSALTNAREIVHSARFFLAVTQDDRENLFSTLMVRHENPDICIFSRCSRPELIPRLYEAGADYVVYIPTIIAQAVCRMMLYHNAQILHSIDHSWHIAALQVTSRRVTDAGSLRKKTQVSILARDRKGYVMFHLSDKEEICESDCLYLMGTQMQIQKAIKKLSYDPQ